MANRKSENTAVETVQDQPETFSLRNAARYLFSQYGIDIGDMRMRSLVRQHEIFQDRPDVTKAKLGDSDVETWSIGKQALDDYAAARANGTVRSSNGAKSYKLLLTQEQLAALRPFLAEQGIAEPKLANAKSSKPKVATSGDGAVASDGRVDEDSLDAQLADGEGENTDEE